MTLNDVVKNMGWKKFVQVGTLTGIVIALDQNPDTVSYISELFKDKGVDLVTYTQACKKIFVNHSMN